MADHSIRALFLSQEDLIRAGCLDLRMAMQAAEESMLKFRRDEVLFPEKIVQIFDERTQERINCLPATFLPEKICGVKWVSVFPPNPVLRGKQNLSALIVLSEIETGFPIAVMEGTLCSNVRVGAMGGIAAKHLAPENAREIGFIGSGEQSKMHLIAMKTVCPSLEVCRVGAKTVAEEEQFVAEMSRLFPDMRIVGTETDLRRAMEGADILVTGTSAQAPLLQADWMKPGSFYSHIGGWEDEYAVARQCDKIVCDDWETVKHRTQTLSRMFQEGELTDEEIHADLVELVAGERPGREGPEERCYFNAVGLSYVDVAIAHAMYRRALENAQGQEIVLQETMIFEHADLARHIRL